MSMKTQCSEKWSKKNNKYYTRNISITVECTLRNIEINNRRFRQFYINTYFFKRSFS